MSRHVRQNAHKETKKTEVDTPAEVPEKGDQQLLHPTKDLHSTQTC